MFWGWGSAAHHTLLPSCIWMRKALEQDTGSLWVPGGAGSALYQNKEKIGACSSWQVYTVSRKGHKPENIIWGLASWEMFHQRRVSLGETHCREKLFSPPSLVPAGCNYPVLLLGWNEGGYWFYICGTSDNIPHCYPKIEISELQLK